MPTVLTITDGDLYADLTDNRSYRFPRGSWAPQVAPLRSNAFGGVGPYDDVKEEIEIDILGSTPDEALANLKKLDDLLDRADRWYSGEPRKAVLLRYRPDHSNAEISQCAILGRPEGSAGRALQAQLHRVGSECQIRGVRIAFRRRGQWLQTAETTGGALLPGAIGAFSFGGIGLPHSPLKLKISGTVGDHACLILAHNAEYGLQIVEGEDVDAWTVAGTGTVTTPSDTGNRARGGEVLRLGAVTPTPFQVYTLRWDMWGNDDVYPLLPTIDGAAALPRRVLLIAMVRVNGTGEWVVRGGAGALSIAATANYGQWKRVASNQGPMALTLGVITAPSPGARYAYIQAQQISGSSTFDIDCVIGLVLDYGYGHAALLSGPGDTVGSGPGVDPSLLTHPNPRAVWRSISGGLPIADVGTESGVRGDPAFTHGESDTAYVAYFGLSGSAWNINASARFVELTRHPATRTPQ